MSYEDGWPKSPYGNAPTSSGFGYQTGLSAFDIAVIQDKYGVNETTRTGNDVYVLPEANSPAIFNPDGTLASKATGYTSIWDAGGIDEIRYDGARNATIDLRPATLKYEVGGGGWMSYTTGATPVYAGFTVANGVVIENATSGSGNDTLVGNSARNILDGGAGNDTFVLTEGGDDRAIGGSGNDVFAFRGAMTSADEVDGGEGNDQISIQGDYATAPLTLGSKVVNVESLALNPGNDTRRGDPGTNFYDYNIITSNENVAAGVQFRVDGARLRAGEDFTFDGSAETDGSFRVTGGLGVDRFTGGNGSDVFYFGPGVTGAGTFGASDVVDGGAGAARDQLALRGDYALTFGAAQLVSIESLLLQSGRDVPQNTDFDYAITMIDANLVGGRMTVDTAQLRATESVNFNGGAEDDGSFRIFGGAGGDTFAGSQLGDSIEGQGGADTLIGNGGNDSFVYRNAAHSTASAQDRILDFTLGDLIDVGGIDAQPGGGNDAFSFIGSNAFTNQAGQLRVEQTQTAGTWLVQGDVDGNGSADLQLLVTVSDGHQLTQADFIV